MQGRPHPPCVIDCAGRIGRSESNRMSLNRSLNPRTGDPVEVSVRDSMLRYLGASFVLLGCLLLAVDGTRATRLLCSCGGWGALGSPDLFLWRERTRPARIRGRGLGDGGRRCCITLESPR